MNKEFHFFLKEKIGTIKLTFTLKEKKTVLTRIYLPGTFCVDEKSNDEKKTEKELINSNRREINIIKKYIDLALSGKNIKIDLRLFDFTGLTKFEKKILIELLKYADKDGTITYKKLGESAGYKNASRAVGNAMSKNPFPVIFPCHRVLRSDGSIGKFQGGTRLKIKLLRATGHIQD
ncbi:MAG TPA: methylated-DNA--[protein]-cysteine S-methyltransferase [bacterium]|nr:methylated-DNA--[protein]-cysteine S-methyltransferase [bacterium]HPN30249.1 methylated-DNA--[protein]-cysteine S-methyltransferase [bacterium]